MKKQLLIKDKSISYLSKNLIPICMLKYGKVPLLILPNKKLATLYFCFKF